MKFKLWHIISLCLITSLLSSLLTVQIVGQSVFDKSRNRAAFIDTEEGNCSGVVIETNRVLTCSHCLPTKGDVKINGKIATLLKIDREKDLALFEVDSIKVDKVIFASTGIGEDVFSFGFPKASPNVVYTKGYVMVRQFGLIYSSNIVMPGSSGAALYDMNGNVVGIIQAYLGVMAVSVPADQIQSFLEDKK